MKRDNSIVGSPQRRPAEVAGGKMVKILITYFSEGGNTEKMARLIGEGAKDALLPIMDQWQSVLQIKGLKGNVKTGERN